MRLTPILNWLETGPQELLAQIAAAGIVGLGGGAFPTATKLRAALAWQAEHNAGDGLLVANGAACEPGIDADLFILEQAPAEVLLGLRICARLLKQQTCVLVLGPRVAQHATSLDAQWQQQRAETKQAVDLHTHLTDNSAAAGAERLLLGALGAALQGESARLAKQAARSAAPPATTGVVVLNLVTLWAVARAVNAGEVLNARPVTMGTHTRWVAFGTAYADLLTDDAGAVIEGGPSSGRLMPVATGDEARVTARTLALHGRRQLPATACIGCGQCAPVCPVDLDPEALHRELSAITLPTGATTEGRATQSALTKTQAAGLTQCIECGACNLACPSHIDLLDTFRRGKAALSAAAAASAQAKRAQERFERHQQRLEERATASRVRRAARLQRARSWTDEARDS